MNRSQTAALIRRLATSQATALTVMTGSKHKPNFDMARSFVYDMIGSKGSQAAILAVCDVETRNAAYIARQSV